MPQLGLSWIIALKDLKRFSKDRFAVLFAVLFPFLFMAMFGLMLSEGDAEDTRLEFHLVMQQGPPDQRLYDLLETGDGSAPEPGQPLFTWHDDYEALAAMVDDDEVPGFLAFPSDFVERIETGRDTELEIVADFGAIGTRAALGGLAGSISSQVGSLLVTARAISELGGDPPLALEHHDAIGRHFAPEPAQGLSGRLVHEVRVDGSPPP